MAKIFLLLTLTVSGYARAGNDLTVSGSDFRVIHGTLLKPDGSPAAGRKVGLAGLNRPYVYADLDHKLSAKHWNFTTDKRGQFTVKIWQLDIQSALAAGLPGDSNYQLVAAPADGEACNRAKRLKQLVGERLKWVGRLGGGGGEKGVAAGWRRGSCRAATDAYPHCAN